MKINISFITSNDFLQTLSVFYWLNANIETQVSASVFLLLSKVSVLVHFRESMNWLFLIQTFISLVIHFPFKWPRQEAKTKQQQNKTTFTATLEAKSVRRQTAVSQRNFFWRVVTWTLRWLVRLHCLLYFLAFALLRIAVLFFLNWTVCLFVKESPIWNYPNRSLIGQFIKG